MKRAIGFIVLLLVACPLYAETGNYYDLQVHLQPRARMLRVTARITFRAPERSSTITFLLNKSLKVSKVECATCKGFRFRTTEPSPYRYMPDGAPLTVELSESVEAGTPVNISISYEGIPTEPAWGVNTFGPDYTELAQYIGWYPLMPEMGRFRYAIDVTTDAGYELAAEGVTTRVSPASWRIVEDADTFDIVIAAAPQMKTRSIRGGELQVAYTPVVDDDTAALVLQQMDATVKTFTGWFGERVGGHLTLLMNGRAKGGSYVRPGFVSMPYNGGSYAAMRRGIVATLGHEVSHLWWTGAPVTTWEDWLNESFAEYSSWLLLKDVFGTAEYEKQVARAREETKDKPPVWGIDRDCEDAYVVLYAKGALLLHNLAGQIGQERFLSLASTTAHSTPRTTTAFLSALENASSQEVRQRFESDLRK